MVTEATREKMRQAKLSNPTRFWLGKTRSKIDRQKMRGAKLGKPFPGISYDWRGKKQSPEHVAKRVLKLMGHTVFEETREKLRMWGINHPRTQNKDTKIELAVEAALQKQNIKYEKHFSLLGIAVVDFYLPEFDSVIQCDGCYWHNCLLHCPNGKVGSRNKDEKQDLRLEEEGIKVFRLWEHEINHPETTYSSSVTLEMVLNYIINK